MDIHGYKHRVATGIVICVLIHYFEVGGCTPFFTVQQEGRVTIDLMLGSALNINVLVNKVLQVVCVLTN